MDVGPPYTYTPAVARLLLGVVELGHERRLERADRRDARRRHDVERHPEVLERVRRRAREVGRELRRLRRAGGDDAGGSQLALSCE